MNHNLEKNHTLSLPLHWKKASTTWHSYRPLVVGLALCMTSLLFVNTWQLFAQNDSSINLGNHGVVQFVDPDGVNAFYFTDYSSAAAVDFAAYELSAAQFSELYYSTNENAKLALPDVSGFAEAATWQVDLNTAERFGEVYATTLPTVSSGLYLVTATADNQEANNQETAASLAVVSRQALLLKHTSTGQTTVWATNLRDGAPSEGMTITLYDADGNTLGQAVTDAQGVAKIQTDVAADYQSELLAVGQLGDEITLTGAGNMWRKYSYMQWYGDASKYNAFINTDRPIYRPGDTVSFAAILRESIDGVYQSVSTTTPVTAKLKDSRGNEVTTVTLTPDEYGMVQADYILGDEPSLGSYQVELTVGTIDENNAGSSTIFRQEFKVEEYEKPEYKVVVSASKPYVISGDAFNITVNSDYFFGQPVRNATVNIKVYKTRNYYYYWWDESDVYYPSYGQRELLNEYNGTTDANGVWNQEYTADLGDQYGAAYSIVATVTDERERPIQGSANVAVHWNTFTLQTRTEKYGYESDEPLLLNLTATDHDKLPVAGQSINVKVEDRVYTGSWRDSYFQTVAEQTVTTGADGKAQANFGALAQGWYRVTSTTIDARGRAVEAYTYIWVYDRTANQWYYYNGEQLSLTVDQAEYGPGDTAQLLIQSRITDTMALVTIEREGVLDEFVVQIDGPVTTLDIPIKEAYKPNAFVKAHIFAPTDPESRDDNSYRVPPEAELIIGSVELSVPAADRRLDVEISSDAAEYGAGDEATFTFQVNNASGEGETARIMVAVVDEAIFSLSEDLTADIFDTFHGKQSSNIFTYGSPISPYFYQDFWLTPTESLEYDLGVGAPTGMPEADRTANGEEVNTRLIFEDTAYWNPMVTTDADGVATVTVPLPDNLTTWRVIARAVTMDTKAGEETGSILVTQEVIARSVLPRFSIVGDRFAASVVGQNYTGQEATGELSMAADGLMLLDNTAQSMTMADGASGSASWTAVASQVGTHLVTSTVSLPTGGDRTELPFITKPFAIPDRQFSSGQVTENEPLARETFDIPLNAVDAATELTVNLSPSIALSLLDNLDSLIRYPYGCVEQTMSRMLPSAAASKVYATLGIPNPKADDLPEIMSKGVQKLYGYQHGDGSWGWFYDDEPGTYLTSYVLFGLQTVQDAGFEVSESAMANGLNYLQNNVGNMADKGTQAYAYLVLSQGNRGDLPAMQALLADVDLLNPFGQAMLAMALNNEGDAAGANRVIDALLADVQETGTTAYWPEDPYEEWTWYHWRTMASADKNTAAALQAITQIRPTETRLPKIVRWLMNERESVSRYYQAAGWSNTQATSFAILGLLDYIELSREQDSNYAYTVKLNDSTIASGEVTPANFAQPIDPIVLSGVDLSLGENELVIERSDAADGANGGALYYMSLLGLELFYNEFEQVSSVDQGIRVARSYELVEGTSRADGAYNVGDIVRATVQVTSDSDKGYIHVSSPIPAGFEGINNRLNTVQYTGGNENFNWYDWGYNRKDFRDDSVDYFITHFYQGEREFSYLMRAITAGEFSVLPAEATAMYREEIWGRSGSEKMLVEPERLVERPELLGDFDNDCRVTRFDLQQIAGEWGTTDLPSTLAGSDGVIDLTDVTLMGKREGASCVADFSAALDTANGEAKFVVDIPSGEYSYGDTLLVNVYLASTTGLNGFDVKLDFESGAFDVMDVEWGVALTGALQLGPDVNISDGYVTFGTYDLPDSVRSGDLLATVTFVNTTVGNATIQAASVHAVNGAGDLIAAEAGGAGDFAIQGEQIFMPVTFR